MDDEREQPEFKSLDDQVEEWRQGAVEVYRQGLRLSHELDQVIASIRNVCDAAGQLGKTIRRYRDP